MSHRHRSAVVRTLCLSSVLVASVLGLGACGGDDDGPTNPGGESGNSTAPSDWVGRWAGSETTTACSGLRGAEFDRALDVFQGLAFFGGDVDTFSVCEGESVDEGLPEELPFECTVTWNDTRLDYSCTGSVTFGNCTASVDFQGSATRAGEQLTTSARTEINYSAGCGLPDECDVSSGSYTRISSTPLESECGSIGSDDGDGGGGVGSNTLTMDVSGNGVNYAFDANQVNFIDVAGQYVVSAAFVGGTNLVASLVLAIPQSEIDTLPMTLCASSSSGGCVVVQYQELVGESQGAMQNVTGTVTITEAAADHIVGTFSLSGDVVGGAGGTRTLSNGAFDASLDGSGLRASHGHFPWARRGPEESGSPR